MTPRKTPSTPPLLCALGTLTLLLLLSACSGLESTRLPDPEATLPPPAPSEEAIERKDEEGNALLPPTKLAVIKQKEMAAQPSIPQIEVPKQEEVELPREEPIDLMGAEKHSVRAGETLGGIALRYQVKLIDLMARNKLSDPDKVVVGTVLKIPRKAEAVLEEKPKRTPLSKVHVVMKGETLGGIALRYQIKLTDLMARNNIANADKVRAGVVLKIPKKGEAVLEEKAIQAPLSGTHVVMKGETLGGIALRYQIKLMDLMMVNNIANADKVRAGVVLKIPKKGEAVLEEKAIQAPLSGTHVVMKGETLGGIALRYQIKLTDLMARNNIANADKVRAGMVLKIPKTNPIGQEKQSEEASEGTKREEVLKGKTHTIAQGETLGGIALRYQVKLIDLMAVNNIANADKVRAGMVLKIPKAAVEQAKEQNVLPETPAERLLENPEENMKSESDQKKKEEDWLDNIPPVKVDD